MKLYLASANPHKVQELRALLSGRGLAVTVESAMALGGMPEVDESAETFSGNAALKASALLERAPAGAWVLADDSGLAVDALGGAPGVRSARFAGPEATDRENIQKVLQALAGESARSARFVCVLCLKSRELTRFFEGVCEGRLLEKPVGEDGFGYDPVFQPDGFSQSFAQLGADIKARYSHRARAVAALEEWMAGRACAAD